mgnify:CR=1 FL=1
MSRRREQRRLYTLGRPPVRLDLPLRQVERRLQKASKDKKTDPAELSALKKLQEALDDGKPARLAGLSDEEWKHVQGLGLLSAKKVCAERQGIVHKAGCPPHGRVLTHAARVVGTVASRLGRGWRAQPLMPSPIQVIYACNVLDSDLESGNAMVAQVAEVAKSEGASHVVVSAQVAHTASIGRDAPSATGLRQLPYHLPPSYAPRSQVESELIDLSPEERAEFLESLGVKAGETGLEKLIAETYELLQLRTYYTSGETETKAWTIRKGTLAPQAAGVIHSDFEKGFIRAETVAYDDLIEYGSMSAAKEAGKVRAEGKEYEVKDGDVMLFRFNP